ncbi:MAG: peptidylprolyl isomerase [Rhodobacteraceae bacterium]|nr:MAG: peptidylprolyl isomerase [Paracoccaceae bacterium]
MRLFDMSSLFRAGLALVVAVTLAASPVAAQGLFSATRKVNDRVITNYDIDQRTAFLEALNPGSADLRAEALRRLTEEAVQRDHARRLNLRINRDDLREGMTEFAARAELSADEFIALLAENGVGQETFESFVEAGLLWRQVVAGTLRPLVAVSDTDLLRARDTAAILGRQRVLISEIFLPTDPQFADPVAQIMNMIESVRTIDEFSRIAREFSLAGSRDQGGRLDWVPLENLPGQIRPIAQLRPGQILGPLEISGAIAYFQLRATESTRDIPADRVQLTYARLLLPGGRSEENLARVTDIRAQVRHCEGLGPFARDLPEEFLTQREALMQEIPASDAVELARLDRFEISANTTEGNNLVVLMLCARELQFDEPPSDDQTRDIVFDRRISAMADLKLQELIADADIRDF